ncbi:hypothetical protein DFP73DRAFT_75435 [Morchella snyderi]|nr:hypothetical protein DFP73DRAFT_75435 [Morchella snyderi]
MSAAVEFEKISGFLQDTLDQLKRFAAYEEHFRSSTREALDLLHAALTDFYVDVIDLTLVVTKHFRTNVIKYVFRRAVKTFDSDFEEILSSMKRHVQAIDPAANLGGIIEARQNYNKEQFLAATKWLFCTNPQIQQEKNQERHLQKTCDWLFGIPEFRTWFGSKYSSRICIQGIPGSGKSMLSSVVIGHLKDHVLPEESIIYFFCKENDTDRDNPLSILRTFIFQLLNHPVHKPQLIPVVHKVLERSGTPSADSIVDLWTLLQKILDMLPPVYCVIDALDECNNKDEQMARFLTQLTERFKSEPALKVFATSRLNESHITETTVKEHWSWFLIGEDNVKRDIDAFISKRIDESVILRDDCRRGKVHSRISQGAGGMILWAKLMLDELSEADSWDVDSLLDKMPDKLSDVYDLMLKRRIPLASPRAKSFDRCQTALHWITIAPRPFLLDELLLALAVAAGLRSHEDYSTADKENSMERLLKACGSLIVILGDNSVQLVHTSLRQYLLGGDINTLSPNNSANPPQNIDQMQIHKDLAKACLLYNQFTCFEKSHYSPSFDFTMYPFLEYSTSNWIYHVTHSKPNDDDLLDEIARFLSSKQAWRWIERCQYYNITDGHLLVMQSKLRDWAEICKTSNPQVDVDRMGGFILDIIKKQSNETQALNVINRVANLYYQQGHHTEALEWYERALAGRKKALGEEHPSTLDIVNNIALVYSDQGRYDEALEWYERALAGMKKALGEEHPSTLSTVNNIALVYSGQGRYDEALEWYERALAGKKKALGEEHPSTLGTVNSIANVYSGQGRYDEALEWYERALAGMKKALGEEHPSTLGTVNNIAAVYSGQGRYDEALEWYERALAGKKKALGEEHPSTLSTVNNIAAVYSNQGRYDEALEWYERALAGSKKALGEEHPSTLGTVNNIALVYSDQGRYDEALEWYERALAGKKKALGEEHPSTLETVNSIANVYSGQGRYDEALEWYERALAGNKKALGEEHPSTLGTVNNIAAVYSGQGRYDEALEWYERALAGKKKALGEEHPSTVSTVNNIAGVYSDQGRYDEALEWYERALAGNKKALGEEHPSTLGTVNNIALVYSDQGRYDEAREWYERALSGLKKALGEEHPSTLDTVNNIAAVYSDQGRYDEALEWYERALAGRKKALGEEHPSTLSTVNNIAAVYSGQGRYDEALELCERALAVFKKALGEEHPWTLEIVNNIAAVYSDQGRYDEALEWYERALAGRKKALGEEHPSTLETVNNIANVYSGQGRYDEALEWFERALAGRKKALGEEHPKTLNTADRAAETRKNLAMAHTE